MPVLNDAVQVDTTFAASAPSGATEGFNTGDRWGMGSPMLLQLAVDGGTSVTVTVHQYLPDAGVWVAVASGVVVSTGTATYLRAAPNTRMFVQPTASAGGPTALYTMTLPGSMT